MVPLVLDLATHAVLYSTAMTQRIAQCTQSNSALCAKPCDPCA
jgi:hypothetical protein